MVLIRLQIAKSSAQTVLYFELNSGNRADPFFDQGEL